MTQQFFKGLFIAVMTALSSALTTGQDMLATMTIALISSALVYTGKNLLMIWPSNSPAGSISGVNILSGIVLAIGTGLTDALGQIIVDHKVVWLIAGKIALASMFTYLGATFFASEHNETKLKLYHSLKNAA